jgi:transglutaminase-like putative cysteine protease/Tfp pilus assembly protein PilF
MLRSGALLLILYQIRLLAKDLADTPLFLAALAAALSAAYWLFRKKARPLEAALTLILIPPASRFFIAFPRFFFADTAVVLDSLLLNLDRNAFVSLVPFYWAGISTYFACRSRAFLRADIIMADMLFTAIFTLAPAAEAYRWPVMMILMVAGVLFPQILALILSAPPELAARKREQLGAAAALSALVIAGCFLFLGPFQEKAAARQGGLLAPNLFAFDFSPFIHLESEISVNDDLVFIVKKDPSDNHILLRRAALSGYTKKQGFFRREDLDEKTHPQRRPEARAALEETGGAGRASRLTEQEYYLVNIDSRAFIAMNKPVLVTPFENWDASSFSAAYSVHSRVNEALVFELFDSAPEEPGPGALGLSPEEYAAYTDYGADRRIAALAREITQGAEYYQEKVELVYQFLKEGEYRYSLKPGIAADGDQLGHFLFTSKKGYCSYYAFAMTLLLRSLHIPARLAAGFFIDSSRFSPRKTTGAPHYFNYYPISANMAHTWVEVCYPGYGWVEYDPTTELLAAGEEFQFSSGMPAEFERLMKEILDNRGSIVPNAGLSEETRENSAPEGLRRLAAPALALLVLAFWALAHTRYALASALSRSPRRKAHLLWAQAKRRLALGGCKPEPGQTESEWVRAAPAAGAALVYEKVGIARYAPAYTAEDFAALARAYRDFLQAYRKALPLRRRVLAWVFPPAALALGPPKKRRPLFPGKAAALPFLLCAALSGDAQNTAGSAPDADSIYAQAQEAQYAEYWEQAIALYTQGLDRYPQDYRFSWALGNLYYVRRLYDLAWDQYRRTEALLPEDTDVLYQLSMAAARLNRNTLSAQYLERVLALDPDNAEAIGSLGWMYSKLHRLGEGRALLLSALERLGPNPDFAMILGTIFSNLFEYDQAKKWYLEAIAAGEKRELREFTAVSQYNLSILESRFYYYDRAFERASASLRAQNRAPGRIARGELFLRRLDFRQAFSDYRTAYEIDPSPLSKINLAQSYRQSGNLEEARSYGEDCLRGGDLSWMLNFGIDPIRYKRDIHEILYQAYAGLAQVQPGRNNWRDQVYGLFQRLRFRYQQEAHLHLFRKYSLLSADVFKTDRSAGGESNLDALMQYYRAFEAYPRRALTYLRKAKTFEAPRIPQSAPFYEYEEARLLKDIPAVSQIIPRFDPVWERDMIAGAYAQIAKFSRGKGADAAAEQLYLLNKGALRQQGIRLPLLFAAGHPARRLAPEMRRELKAAGFAPRADGALRFRLQLDQQGLCELFDGNKKLLSYTLHSREDIPSFIQDLQHLFFPPAGDSGASRGGRVCPLRGVHVLPAARGFAILVTTQKLRLSGLR